MVTSFKWVLLEYNIEYLVYADSIADSRRKVLYIVESEYDLYPECLDARWNYKLHEGHIMPTIPMGV